MSHDPQTSTASPEKKALLEAFDTVLKTKAQEREAELAAAEARRRGRGISRLVMLVCVTILVFVSAYLYVERPDWIFPTPPRPESLAVREASLRITMATAAQYIERFRQRSGRLPASLTEAGAYGEGIAYQRTAAGYRLEGESDEVRVTFDSTEPLARFVGNSFRVISRRAR
jgi:hypothetical protein